MPVPLAWFFMESPTLWLTLLLFPSESITPIWLKEEADGGYKVLRGGWFEVVSYPNYFRECVEWLGWALMTWSCAGLGFLLFTCANLVPRARANHKWYLDKFGEDYPKSRKAVIPFLY
ncbi:3-oxo-5-alpha-steroid 4-dehydrogenase, C-terminal [Trema orientale]|uniref:3-oxo-5-alpha-steroid 4-dehydrogenase, C-terminal n=1 Tax=Trema orientale TaxID=63057 RepID=A0A2P5EX94_TREOI|nr:3-oxo-5-alpha-steroid 4-dehydrogenase, C-terminal [Trema orientale]